eukprot:3684442-Prymnesium_polylepis.1
MHSRRREIIVPVIRTIVNQGQRALHAKAVQPHKPTTVDVLNIVPQAAHEHHDVILHVEGQCWVRPEVGHLRDHSSQQQSQGWQKKSGRADGAIMRDLTAHPPGATWLRPCAVRDQKQIELRIGRLLAYP